MDLNASIDPDEYGNTYRYIRTGGTVRIQTGFAVEIPNGYEMQIRARSSMAAQGILLSNGVGTIDSDYRGEVGVLLTNTSSDIYLIEDGDRIAQCKIEKVIPFEFVCSDELTDTERGTGGYGSTGR